MKIRSFVLVLAVGALAGCGADTMSAAATAASIKKQEVQEAQKTLERAQDRIGQAMEVQQQRANLGE